MSAGIVTEPLDVVCPRCHRRTGKPCLTATGAPHTERVDLAAEWTRKAWLWAPVLDRHREQP
jgi:hypothetical protein